MKKINPSVRKCFTATSKIEKIIVFFNQPNNTYKTSTFWGRHKKLVKILLDTLKNNSIILGLAERPDLLQCLAEKLVFFPAHFMKVAVDPVIS